MRLRDISTPLLSLTTLLLTQPTTALAPLPRELLPSLEDNQNVEKRCQYSCGYYGQLCCGGPNQCTTNEDDEAICLDAVTATVAGVWEYSTSVYMETDYETITTVLSSFVPESTQQVVVTTSTLSCQYALGECDCGTCCCVSGQYCQTEGNCVWNGGGSSGYYSTLFTVTVLGSASEPLRQTSVTSATVTVTGSITTTVPYITPAATDGSIISGTPTTTSHALSGGAIAGIVIGVIVGIILLLIICACWCGIELVEGVLGIFGLGPHKRTREETTVVEERRSRRDGSGGRTWFGSRPARGSRTSKERSGWGGAATVATFLGGLALILGLKRRADRNNEKTSTVSGSYYYDSEYSSRSSESSAPRTRDSRRSRSRR